MEVFEAIKKRRSVRSYTSQQISQEDLAKILEAGAWAPNSGEGQRTQMVAVCDAKFTERIGKLHFAAVRNIAIDKNVYSNPQVLDSFYGAPTAVVIFAPENYNYSTADAYCTGLNMSLEATELGISSVVISNMESTFTNPIGREIAYAWRVPPSSVARACVLLGYCEGEYPAAPEMKPGRIITVGGAEGQEINEFGFWS